MQFPHEASNVATTVIAQQLLVEYTILLIVVKLESAAFLAAKDTAQGLVDEALTPDWQVFLKIVVKSDAVVCIFEELDVLLKIFKVELLLRLEEKRPIGLHCFKALGFLVELQDSLFAGIHAEVNFLQLAIV